ncbi:unnamed protein product [Calypogeia fissa]
MPMNEKGNALDRLIGAMKVPTKGSRVVSGRQQEDAVLASMEIDNTLHSSRIKAFPSSRKRMNVDIEEKQRSEEPIVATPPNGTRTPARLRLSVSRKSRDSRDSKDSRDSRHLLDYEGEIHDSDDHESISREEFPLTDRRRALFEPLGPAYRGPRDTEDDTMLPPPDFETASYPRGWVVGKKRKLVNVDVVESMRRIAVHEMNRKDREINGLNEQLEEDSRTMEHLQVQLQQERTKRLQAERENNMLQGQINMLMTMLNEEAEEGEDIHGP